MKALRIAALGCAIALGTLVTGCGNSYLKSVGLDEVINNTAAVATPIKVNDTFTVTNVTKLSNSAILDIKISDKGAKSINKYLDNDLKGKLSSNPICFSPDFKSGKTSVTLHIYSNKGKLLKTFHKSSNYLCM